VRIAGCVEGRVIACVCSDGRTGNQTCLANDQFSACECSGELKDAGDQDDGGFEDSGSGDVGFREDVGFGDSGFDGGLPNDAGDSGPRDVGFEDSGFDSGFPDSGFPDSGFPDSGFDSGIRETGFPDTGPIFDGGFPDFDGGTGGPCSTDTDCNLNNPLPLPLYICVQNTCEFGCLYYEFVGTPICVSPQVCDFTTGRCL